MKFSNLKLTGAGLLFLLLLLVPAITLADAQTGVCTSGTKTAAEVGVFMQDVCGECYNDGNCSVADIMTLVANIGNFILSIVASLVFLIYIIGGFFWIASHGDPAWVTKGKKYITGASFGLIIILVAYTGVVALRSALVGQLSEDYVICAGDETNGQECDVNSVCSSFSCISRCEASDGFCTDTESAAAFESREEGLCSDGAGACPVETQSCCIPVSE